LALFPEDLNNIINGIERGEDVDVKSYMTESDDCGLEIFNITGDEKPYVLLRNLNNHDVDISVDSELFLHMIKDVLRSTDNELGEIMLTYFDDGTSREDI